MRSHPVVGTLFLLAGTGLLALGALTTDAPAFLKGLPIPPEIIVPFILWQLAVWSILFGIFFLRPRSRWQKRRVTF